jgi:hypothetical protein
MSAPNLGGGHEEVLLDVPKVEPTDGVHYPHVPPELLPTPGSQTRRSLSTAFLVKGLHQMVCQRDACPLAAPGLCP